MKINRFETHDRLVQFQQQRDTIHEGVMECIRNVPDAINFPFYVYGTSKIVDYDEKIAIIKGGYEQAPDMRLIWVPCITKPKPTPNSYLFLYQKSGDVLETIWMLPRRALWSQYLPGKICYNESIHISIINYTKHYDELCQPEPNGPTLQNQQDFFEIIKEEAKRRFNERKNINIRRIT